MVDAKQENDLYLTVLPVIHMGDGLTEQILTLLPDREQATQFFADEVQSYMTLFKSRANKYLSGGHVRGYDLWQEAAEDGRIRVRVTQNVA